MMATASARLVLGPLLRYVGDDEATVWVETDRACRVEVLGCSSPTFCVAGHHYGFVCVSGLESGACLPYRATSTTPTSPRPPSPGARRSRAPSCKRSARRFATRWTGPVSYTHLRAHE